MHITVLYKHLESSPDKYLIGNLARHSFSLFDRNLPSPQAPLLCAADAFRHRNALTEKGLERRRIGTRQDRNKTQPQTSKTSEQRLAYHQQNDGRLQKFAVKQILC